MLINVFSSHRTGSTWWAHYIKNQYSNGKLYNEIFNQVRYLRDAEVGSGKFVQEEDYTDSCFWRAPDDSCTEIVNNYRELVAKDSSRFNKWLQFFKQSTDTVVCHTHLSPLQDNKYLTELSKIGDKNYYVYRENVLEQLASFVILEHTGEFGVTTKDKANISTKFTYPIIDIKSIEWKSWEIIHSEEIVNKLIVNFEKIKYESMPFNETIDGMPLKQNVSAFNRLCLIDQELIKQIYSRAQNVK